MATYDSDVRIAPVRAEDQPAVLAFLAHLPLGEHAFLKADPGDPAVVASWAAGTAGRYLVARRKDEVVGVVAVVPGLGWSAHVGDLRLVVDPARRGHGVGAALARRAMSEAMSLGLRKVTVEVPASQTGVCRLFSDLGFIAEALLADQLLRSDGALEDLLVFAHPVPETLGALAAMGLDTADVQTC